MNYRVRITRREWSQAMVAGAAALGFVGCSDDDGVPAEIDPFVDPHMHTFNLHDLPLQGFVLGFIGADHDVPLSLALVAGLASRALIDNQGPRVGADRPAAERVQLEDVLAAIKSEALSLLRRCDPSIVGVADDDVSTPQQIQLWSRADPSIRPFIAGILGGATDEDREETDTTVGEDHSTTTTSPERTKAELPDVTLPKVHLRKSRRKNNALVIAQTVRRLLGTREDMLRAYLQAYPDVELAVSVVLDFDFWRFTPERHNRDGAPRSSAECAELKPGKRESFCGTQPRLRSIIEEEWDCIARRLGDRALFHPRDQMPVQAAIFARASRTGLGLVTHRVKPPLVLGFMGFNPRREVLYDCALAAWVPQPGELYPPEYDPFGTGDPTDVGAIENGILVRPPAQTAPSPAPEDVPAERADALRLCTRAHQGPHPEWTAIKLIREAVEAHGYAGVKLYPSNGFLPLGNREATGHEPTCTCDSCCDGARIDAALRALYTYCVALDVPIMAHTNRSNAATPGAGANTAPPHWKTVLDDFCELRINFGHMGQSSASRGAPGHGQWRDGLMELAGRHEHVYGDVSAGTSANSSGSARQEAADYRRLAATGPLRDRLMYGTDWFLNVLSSKTRHPTHPHAYAAIAQGAFPDEAWDAAFMRQNALRYLGLSQRGNLNRERLLARWGETHPDLFEVRDSP